MSQGLSKVGLNGLRLAWRLTGHAPNACIRPPPKVEVEKRSKMRLNLVAATGVVSSLFTCL